MKHANLEHGRWALTCWLLAIVFISVSLYYGTHHGATGFLVWLIVGAVWLYFATRATATFIWEKRSKR